jgi:hypothetical protein
LSEEDAADLAVFTPDADEGAADSLEVARRFRADAVAALRAGIVEGNVGALVHLAELLPRAETSELKILGELLADAALLAAGVSPELVRHRAVIGALSEIARAAGARPLAAAAVAAADYPPDNRRGNRRLHFEGLLLALTLSGKGSSGADASTLSALVAQRPPR